MTLRLILTPDDQPISEAAARAQITAEWVKAQNELADILLALPSVSTPLISGADMTFTPDDLRHLTEDARTISFHVSMLSVALDNAADIASRVRTEAGL